MMMTVKDDADNKIINNNQHDDADDDVHEERDKDHWRMMFLFSVVMILSLHIFRSTCFKLVYISGWYHVKFQF